MNPIFEVDLYRLLFLVFAASPALADTPQVFLDRAIVPLDASEIAEGDLPKTTQIKFAMVSGWRWTAVSALCIEPWFRESAFEGNPAFNYTLSIDAEGLAAFAITDDTLPAEVLNCVGEVVLAIPSATQDVGVMRTSEQQTFKYDMPFGSPGEDNTVVQSLPPPPNVGGETRVKKTLEDYVRLVESTLASVPG